MEPVEIAAGAFQLRPWEPQDIDPVHEACQDPDIQRWTRVPSPYARGDAERFVTEHAPRGWAEGTEAGFAVKEISTARLMAAVSIHTINLTDHSGELGYWVAPWARGTGVATHAARAICRWAFASDLVEAIHWYAAADNPGSRRVAEKVGFTIEGRLRSFRRPRSGDGPRLDFWYGSLLPHELSV